MASTDTRAEIGGHRLRVTNLEKVLYPEAGFTKAQVLQYYLDVAPAMLPHLRDRPLTMRRFPDGVGQDGFYGKHPPTGTPPWVRRVHVPRHAGGDSRGGDSRGDGRSETMEFPVVGDVASLAWAANLAAIELHVPMWCVARNGRPSPPDLMVLDLDPGPPADIVQCCEVALILRHALEREHGWAAYPKTSGAKGLQLYVPLPKRERQRRFDDGGTRDEARHLAEHLAREHSQLIVANMRRDQRRGRVLVDWSQNHVAKTTVAPYSLRALPQPSASTPVTWEEVERAAHRGRSDHLRFGPHDVADRLQRMGDLFAALVES